MDLQQLADDIARHGARAVFGITGSGATLTLLDALAQRDVEPVRTFTEGSAAMMAGVVGRLSGRAGVAYCIKGPGFSNLIPGVAASWFDACPMVAVTEAYPQDSGPEKAHKRVDQPALAAAVSKAVAWMPAEGSTFASLAAVAEAEVPGPVVLQLARGESPTFPAAAGDDPGDDPSMIVGRIERAARPVVIAGTLAIRQRWGAELARLKVPVFSVAAAKGVLDERAAMAAGVYTGVGLEMTPEHLLMPQADLVVGLGLRPAECLATRPFGCAAVNIDPVSPAGVEAFQFDATARRATSEVWDALADKQWGGDDLAASLEALRAQMRDRFLPGVVFESIADVLGPGVRMILDTGYFCTIGEHAWNAPDEQSCLLSGQGRYMGTAIPMGIGAAIHEPSRPAVVVVGDGGIAMNLGEVRLAVERQLPVLFVLMSDGRFGSVATRALKDGLTLAPLSMRTASWSAVMEGFGMPVWRALTPGDVDQALRAWTPEAGCGFLEINFNPDLYERMCSGIR